MEKARNFIHRFILGITGIMVALIVLRMLLISLGANPTHFFVQLVYDLSLPLVSPFLVIGSGIPSFGLFGEWGSVVALLVWIITGLLVSSFLSAFLNDDPVDIVVDIVDSFLKLFEFFLGARLVLALFGFVADQGIAFVSTVFSFTNWANGILPSVRVLQGELSFSVLLMLVIIIVFDLGLESAVENYRKPSTSSGS